MTRRPSAGASKQPALNHPRTYRSTIFHGGMSFGSPRQGAPVFTMDRSR